MLLPVHFEFTCRRVCYCTRFNIVMIVKFNYIFVLFSEIPKVKPGRKSIVQQFPEIPKIMEDFLLQHSSEAQIRRRDDTIYNFGVSLEDIRKHLLKMVPGLKVISRDTVHRLMLPPRKNTLQAKKYKGIVNGRVPAKSNNKSKEHQDIHMSCTQICYASELSSLFEDECVSLSCDDKCKINVGTLAVSRYFQHNKFFHLTEKPDYPDHDFPHPDSKLVPSGYMVLTNRKERSTSLPSRFTTFTPHNKRSRSRSPPRQHPKSKSYIDSRGRERISWPRTGYMTMQLSAAKFHSSTSQRHATHLYEILKPIVHDKVTPKTVVNIISDGGPDWNSQSVVNLINYGRLWRDLKLDGLIISAYAPGHSRLNPIERAWAPMSKWLTGVTLPRSLEGESKPPYKQTELSADQMLFKEARVFDNACAITAKHWSKKYNTFPISVKCVPALAPSDPNCYTDHEYIKKFVKCTKTALESDSKMRSLQDEYKFFVKHGVRKIHQLELYKCKESTCNHCISSPVRALGFFSVLERFDSKLPDATKAWTKDQHRTMLQNLDFWDEATMKKLQCGSSKDGLGKCKMTGCRYRFFSKADEERHMSFIHRDMICENVRRGRMTGGKGYRGVGRGCKRNRGNINGALRRGRGDRSRAGRRGGSANGPIETGRGRAGKRKDGSERGAKGRGRRAKRSSRGDMSGGKEHISVGRNSSATGDGTSSRVSRRGRGYGHAFRGNGKRVRGGKVGKTRR